MPNASVESENLEYVSRLMQTATEIIAGFAPNYTPQAPEMPHREPSAEAFMESEDPAMLNDPALQEWLNKVLKGTPEALVSAFLECSSAVGQFLRMFGAPETASFGVRDLISEPETFELMMKLAQLTREAEDVEKKEGNRVDPLGLRKAIYDELLRRRAARGFPCSRTVTTLLGPNALLWLTAKSSRGAPNIQPHEYRRSEWWRVWDIENQIAIEQELLNAPSEGAVAVKLLVALCWTVVGLATVLPPDIFLGDKSSFISSERGDQLTLSGGAYHTFVELEPSSMPAVLRILQAGLHDPLLSGADLMWIAAALVRVREVRSGLGQPARSADDRFEFFISHRGRDAKQQLSAMVQNFPPRHGVFLDCLTLPRGVINRSFIYGSMARSQKIVIVDTENYQESDWCKKELWVASALAEAGLVKYERTTLESALSQLETWGPRSSRQYSDLSLVYPISQRVLRDLDYWARSPNLHSLKEKGHPADSLTRLQELLHEKDEPDDAEWVTSIGRTVNETLSAVVQQSPGAEPFDLWASALQLCLAAFASTSNTLSKVEVRHGVDKLNAVLRKFVASDSFRDPVFRHAAPQHLALLAGASAIDLSKFQLDPRVFPALRLSIGDASGLRDGLLLLDVRRSGPERDFRLSLLALLIEESIGSVGIVQDATDTVHNSRIGTLRLEILPCVTLYPGMQAPFGLQA